MLLSMVLYVELEALFKHVAARGLRLLLGEVEPYVEPYGRSQKFRQWPLDLDSCSCL